MSELAEASSATPATPAAPAPAATPSAAPSTTPATGSKTAAPAPGGKSATPDPALSTSKLADAAPDASKPATAAEVKAEEARRKYRLKVDGADKELDLTDAEITTRLQKALAADKRMAEAAQIRKEKQDFDERFTKDPFTLAKERGIDLEALAEQRIIEKFQAEQLKAQDPAAYEREQLKKERDEIKARLEKHEAEVKAKAQAEYDAKVGQQMEQDFFQALEESGLPKDRAYLLMMARVADENLANDIELTPQQMAAEVKAQIREQHQYVTRGLKGEALVSHLGDDVVQEVVKYHIAKFKPKQSVAAPVGEKPGSAPGDGGDPSRPPRNMKDGAALRKFQRSLK